MCYSAEASFLAGSLLAVIGFGAIKKALQYDNSMFIFSLFPAIFALHQFIEGAVWLSLGSEDQGAIAFRYLYVIIALLLWPVLTPLAAVAAENDRRRKRFWMLLFVLGALVTGYLAVQLASANGIEVSVVGHSLSYSVRYASPPLETDYAYAVITILPLVLTRNRVINAAGVGVGATFLYSFFEMRAGWFSVWCMSSALLSILFFFSIPSIKDEAATKRSAFPV